MTENYEDIIHLPHHTSKKHLRMTLIDRAAQFAPFAALTGYGDALQETIRLTERKIELDEYERDALNDRLRLLLERQEEHPEITVTYFVPDQRKEGGAYVTVAGEFKKLDEYEGILKLADGKRIPLEDILMLEGEIFD